MRGDYERHGDGPADVDAIRLRNDTNGVSLLLAPDEEPVPGPGERQGDVLVPDA